MSRRNVIPRTVREAEARERALATLALMRREKFSLTAAAKAEHTRPQTVRRYVGSTLRQKRAGERYRPTTHDRIPRALQIVTPSGTRPVTVRDSRTASRIGQYMNAVRLSVSSGDSSGLARFRGKSFQAGGKTYRFITDPSKLDRLADADALAIEGLYRAIDGMTV